MMERLFARSDIDSFVIPGEKLSYDFWGGEHSICNEAAYIQFDYDVQRRTCDITDLWSKKAGQGKRIVGEMVKALGPGIKVSGAVIEDETITKLLSFPIVREALSRNNELTISDRRILKQLKIVRVFEGGWVITERVIVKPPTEDEVEADLNMDVRYFGHT